VWGSKREVSAATSIVEAEFMNASHAEKEANWLKVSLRKYEWPFGVLN
jgi:hypothetical protein